jgi:hypothetical protein
MTDILDSPFFGFYMILVLFYISYKELHSPYILQMDLFSLIRRSFFPRMP